MFDRPLVVLCFENRSGSNFLAALLRTSGKIHGLGEALNFDTVKERAAHWGVTSFPDYMARFAATDMPEVGVKASWDQLLMLMRFGIHNMFSGLKLIYVRREDTVAQAVSRHIAFQTGKWTSEIEVAKSIEPTFDAFEIAQHFTAVQRADRMFDSIFQVFDLDVYRVTYEGVVDRPNMSAIKVMEFLGHDLPDWRPRRDITLRRQANALNDAFQQRFRREMKAMILEGSDDADQ